MRPLAGVFAVLVCAFAAQAQDVLTIGTGTAQVPVYLLDRSGTPLGGDATGIEGFAFKVMFDADAVSAISFARAGVAASATPMFETTFQGDGWISVIVSFSEPLPLTLNASAPGDQIGTLTVTAASAPVLRIDPPSAFLSNQTASVVESVSAGNLSIAKAVFTDDPLVPQVTVVKLVHITELRDAVNAMRASAGLSPMSADPTIAAGAAVRAQHITDVRTALNEARTALALPPVTFTDSPPVVIRAIHIEELRDGVQ